ncbi:uncharacterized protein KY384_000265 [Bacidia gigantensis]|uniref:uncharacterized protein n=1 Tax=Bacidia gigantensis TaxID=2732470 RepID=UPI001D05763A|nr:uncharacterized protein KY384_000265 [Bacidia gigantensis]KAG8526272.1 hypothetical protein KY384_000265 [Bacidia gigantensis]
MIYRFPVGWRAVNSLVRGPAGLANLEMSSHIPSQNASTPASSVHPSEANVQQTLTLADRSVDETGREIDQFKDKFLGGDEKKKESSKEQESQSQPPGLRPQGGPQLPPGWVAQFDQNSQRWYYLEQATGRTQWDPPSFYPSQPPPGSGAPHGAQAPPSQGAQYGGVYPASGEEKKEEKKDKKDKSGRNIALGAAGGLAAGGALGYAMRTSLANIGSHD